MTRTNATRPTIIKLGGQPASSRSLFTALAAEISQLGATVAVVHGGGKEVSDIARSLGHNPRFEDGVRITTPAEMGAVEMVLSGLVNKRLVRWFAAEGVKAVGIGGADASLFVGSPLRDSDGLQTRTASVTKVNPGIVRHLWAGGYVPVIAPPGSDEEFQPVNINADDIAMALAQAVQAASLVFVSDVPGVLSTAGAPATGGSGTKATPIQTLTRDLAAKLIADGTISGGMIPKVNGSLSAIAGGVGQVIIGSYSEPGDLLRLIGGSIGTRIVEEE